MAKTHVKTGDVWEAVNKIHVKEGNPSTWKEAKKVYIKENDIWKEVHSAEYVYNETISVDTANYDLRSKMTSAPDPWNGTDDVNATITVPAPLYIYSTSTGSSAFIVNPALPAGSSVTVELHGKIRGKGGVGGKGGPGTNPTPNSWPGPRLGAAGGPALNISSPVTINLYPTGSVNGGGGGGNGGAGGYANNFKDFGKGTIDVRATVGGSGGGGGGGYSTTPGGAAGVAQPGTDSPVLEITRLNGLTGLSGGTSNGGPRPTRTANATVPAPSSPAPYVIRSQAISGASGSGGAAGSSGGTGGTSTTPLPYMNGPVPAPFEPTHTYTPDPASCPGSGGAAGSPGIPSPFITVVPQP